MFIWEGLPSTQSGGVFFPNTPPVSTPRLATGQVTYDHVLLAPRCLTAGAICGTVPGTTNDLADSLVNGRAEIPGGPEPNEPNTLRDTCADGTSGTYHASPSIDRLRVFTLDGDCFAAGEPVRVDATIWVSSTSSVSLDFFSTPDASSASPSWTLIQTLRPVTTGQQTLSAFFTLPTGLTQAVRAQFRYRGANNPCSPVFGTTDDRDDLVSASPARPLA